MELCIHSFGYIFPFLYCFLLYFFLSYLSLMDVCFTSTVAPKLITASKPSRRPSPTTAAWPRCFLPTSLEPLRCTYDVHMPTSLEPLRCSYDCYAAICRPLHYMVIMNRQVYYVLVMASAMGAFSHSVIQVLIIIDELSCKLGYCLDIVETMMHNNRCST